MKQSPTAKSVALVPQAGDTPELEGSALEGPEDFAGDKTRTLIAGATDRSIQLVPVKAPHELPSLEDIAAALLGVPK